LGEVTVRKDEGNEEVFVGKSGKLSRHMKLVAD
jgi:hypothetical protein